MRYTRLLFVGVVGFAVAFLLTPLIYAQANEPRVDRLIDAGWRFLRQDAEHAEQTSFDDSGWEQVNLPHTWIQETQNGRSTYYAGPCWYRYHLQIDPALSGKRLFIRFGAASRVSQVFVNGQLAGTHRGAFGAFCIPISDAAHSGDNLIAVRADNAGDPEVAPLSGDFTTYGGLFRSVHLLALDPIHITPLDDGGPGVYLKTTVRDDAAAVQATCKLRNDGNKSGDVQITATVYDASGQSVASANQTQSLSAASDGDAVLKLSIPHPHRWDGRADPYLYSAIVELRSGERVLDRVAQPLGLRTFKVDPQTGLTLNGHAYDMHGVNYHEGRPSVGFASTPEMEAEDNQLICELGATGVRMAHYQHDENEYALCDKAGLIVWTELALVNRMNDTPAFRENIKQQLRELIKQNYNHPSVFFWSMYNEVWVGGKNPSEEQWKLVDELVALAHQLDPDRLTTGAAVDGVNGPVNWYMDVTGMNRYDGWYGKTPQDWSQTVAALAQRYPGKMIGISEYGAGASVKQHESPARHPVPGSKWHPEEWQGIVHEHAWDALSQDHQLWCKLLWCMFDFGSVGRNEGDTPGINDKGLVTADRKTRKDAFFFYKACWTKEPFVYVTERRFNPRPPGKLELKVYSNCDSVELRVNGVSIGSQTAANHVFHWQNADLANGQATVEAIGSSAGKTVSDAITWTIGPVPSTQP